MKCSENHSPLGCFQFDVQKCPRALETLDDFQSLSPTLGTHTCTCQWRWWEICLKKVYGIGLYSDLVFIMHNKLLIYFFLLCPAWTIKPLSHSAFISNQLHSLVLTCLELYNTQLPEGKNGIKTPEDVKIHMFGFTVLQQLSINLMNFLISLYSMCVFLLRFLAAVRYVISCSPPENKPVFYSRGRRWS